MRADLNQNVYLFIFHYVSHNDMLTTSSFSVIHILMVDSILCQNLHFFIMLRLYYFNKTDGQSVNATYIVKNINTVVLTHCLWLLFTGTTTEMNLLKICVSLHCFLCLLPLKKDYFLLLKISIFVSLSSIHYKLYTIQIILELHVESMAFILQSVYLNGIVTVTVFNLNVIGRVFLSISHLISIYLVRVLSSVCVAHRNTSKGDPFIIK
jgi:hypothetical protein